MTQTTRERFDAHMASISAAIADMPVGKDMEAFLNEKYPASSPIFADIESLCRQAIAEGWMCKEGRGDVRWGRVSEPSPKLHDFSVDVVSMAHDYGPHHSHPMGEIVLTMPQTPAARFDSCDAGWLVYPPGSGHYPTVTGGPALVLYLLPKGKIAFTR
ncbi:conserved hypothetical protein [Rhodospirillaceae bacterium LM-1]|nr:conserved hypothetical protein [Rhodospirillaceae bacterium LM-1]